MATLPVSRFKELAAEVLSEIEKRFASIAKEFDSRYGVSFKG
jgi:hypothetical protein